MPRVYPPVLAQASFKVNLHPEARSARIPVAAVRKGAAGAGVRVSHAGSVVDRYAEAVEGLISGRAAEVLPHVGQERIKGLLDKAKQSTTSPRAVAKPLYDPVSLAEAARGTPMSPAAHLPASVRTFRGTLQAVPQDRATMKDYLARRSEARRKATGRGDLTVWSSQGGGGGLGALGEGATPAPPPLASSTMGGSVAPFALTFRSAAAPGESPSASSSTGRPTLSGGLLALPPHSPATGAAGNSKLASLQAQMDAITAEMKALAGEGGGGQQAAAPELVQAGVGVGVPSTIPEGDSPQTPTQGQREGAAGLAASPLQQEKLRALAARMAEVQAQLAEASPGGATHLSLSGLGGSGTSALGGPGSVRLGGSRRGSHTPGSVVSSATRASKRSGRMGPSALLHELAEEVEERRASLRALSAATVSGEVPLRPEDLAKTRGKRIADTVKTAVGLEAASVALASNPVSRRVKSASTTVFVPREAGHRDSYLRMHDHPDAELKAAFEERQAAAGEEEGEGAESPHVVPLAATLRRPGDVIEDGLPLGARLLSEALQRAASQEPPAKRPGGSPRAYSTPPKLPMAAAAVRDVRKESSPDNRTLQVAMAGYVSSMQDLAAKAGKTFVVPPMARPPTAKSYVGKGEKSWGAVWQEGTALVDPQAAERARGTGSRPPSAAAAEGGEEDARPSLASPGLGQGVRPSSRPATRAAGGAPGGAGAGSVAGSGSVREGSSPRRIILEQREAIREERQAAAEMHAGLVKAAEAAREGVAVTGQSHHHASTLQRHAHGPSGRAVLEDALSLASAGAPLSSRAEQGQGLQSGGVVQQEAFVASLPATPLPTPAPTPAPAAAGRPTPTPTPSVALDITAFAQEGEEEEAQQQVQQVVVQEEKGAGVSAAVASTPAQPQPTTPATTTTPAAAAAAPKQEEGQAPLTHVPYDPRSESPLPPPVPSSEQALLVEILPAYLLLMNTVAVAGPSGSIAHQMAKLLHYLAAYPELPPSASGKLSQWHAAVGTLEGGSVVPGAYRAVLMEDLDASYAAFKQAALARSERQAAAAKREAASPPPPVLAAPVPTIPPPTTPPGVPTQAMMSMVRGGGQAQQRERAAAAEEVHGAEAHEQEEAPLAASSSSSAAPSAFVSPRKAVLAKLRRARADMGAAAAKTASSPAHGSSMVRPQVAALARGGQGGAGLGDAQHLAGALPGLPPSPTRRGGGGQGRLLAMEVEEAEAAWGEGEAVAGDAQGEAEALAAQLYAQLTTLPASPAPSPGPELQPPIPTAAASPSTAPAAAAGGGGVVPASGGGSRRQAGAGVRSLASPMQPGSHRAGGGGGGGSSASARKGSAQQAGKGAAGSGSAAKRKGAGGSGPTSGRPHSLLHESTLTHLEALAAMPLED